jgi:soluble lytic murein transglycosylase
MRIWISVVVALFLVLPGLAQANSRPLAKAMHAMKLGDWDGATSLARKDGQAAVDVITWHRLRAGKGSYADVIAFMARNPDWPGLPWLIKRSESQIIKASHESVRAFFNAHPPQTPEGVLSYARALEHYGESKKAREVVIAAFRTMELSQSEQDNFLGPHGKILAPHIKDRMDHELWNGWTTNANRLMPHVSDDWTALARARIALRKRQDGVNALIDKVPSALKNDPGMAFERFVWRARKGQDNAIDMILERSKNAKTLGRPEAWAPRRRSLARSEMRKGNHARAYQIASSHHITPDENYQNYADLEWLSGYIALRFLNKPDLALAHFDRFTNVVFTPISLGRSGYWRGRALEAMGNKQAAQEAYKAGALHQTSFYGLLAAEKAGVPFDKALAGKETFPNWKAGAWTKSSVHKAAVLLLASGEVSLAERFWTPLA